MDIIQHIISKYDISQIAISESKKKDFMKFKEKYDYKSNDKSTLFIGVFRNEDINIIYNHNGKKYILWTGNDCNPNYNSRINNMKKISKLPIENNLCISDRVNKFLKKGNIIKNYTYIKNTNFSLNDMQIHISLSLLHFTDRIKKKYSMKRYSTLYEPIVFFGMYNEDDLDKLRRHKEKIYIMWGGNDSNLKYKKRKNNFKIIKEIPNVHHIAISNDIYESLKNENLNPIRFNLNLVDTNIFKPVNKLGNKILIYNGINIDQNETYGKEIYKAVVEKLPEYEFIYSNTKNLPYNKMPQLYSQCFIGLRLTKHDGNANMVQEMEAMNIPVIHNSSDYGLKWKSVDDIISHIKKNKYYDFYNDDITNKDLELIYNNIDMMNEKLKNYKNILFICSDYPGNGGAATNCYHLLKYYSRSHNVKGIFYNFKKSNNKIEEDNKLYSVINEEDIVSYLYDIDMEPDLIILKNFIKINLKDIFNCPIYFFVAGIYTNELDCYYNELKTTRDHNKYINISVINQIKNADFAFTNSSHTNRILKNIYSIDTEIFYSNFINYYGKTVFNNTDFNQRKYDYGLIVSDFNRKIKNIKKSLKFLRNKENVILIGKNSTLYKNDNFDCIEYVPFNNMTKYYKQIKYIRQDSYYDSCSNVKVEAFYNGCKKNNTITILFVCGDITNIGGAATNTYNLLKMIKKEKNYYGIGLYISKLDPNNYILDPDNIGNIYHITLNSNIEENIRSLELQIPEINFIFCKNYKVFCILKKMYKNTPIIYSPSGIRYVGLNIKNQWIKDIDITKTFWKKINNYELVQSNNLDTFIAKNDKYIEKCVFTEESFIICNSRLTHSIVKSYFDCNKINTNRLLEPIYLSNISYTEDYKKGNYNFEEREFDVGFISTSWHRNYKNYYYVISLVNLEKFKEMKIVVIGKKQNTKRYINNNVTSIDFLSKCEITKMYKKIKTVVIPSKYDSNPNTLVEAANNGCNIVTSRNTGNSEYLSQDLIVNNYRDIDVWVNRIELSLTKKFNYNGPMRNDIRNSLIKQIENIYYKNID